MSLQSRLSLSIDQDVRAEEVAFQKIINIYYKTTADSFIRTLRSLIGESVTACPEHRKNISDHMEDFVK